MAANPLLDPVRPSSAPRLLLTARDAAKALAVCEKSLWNFTQPRGTLPAVKLGRAVRYDPADLQAFIEQMKGVADE